MIIESSFSHTTNANAKKRMVDVPIIESDIMRMIAHSISSATWDKEGTLTLVFDDSQTFRCYDTSPNYESYQIRHGKKVIVV
jgi:hypothetical protein